MAAANTNSKQRPGDGGRAMDDDDLTFETSAGVEAITSFDVMKIRDDLLHGIYCYGFDKPSAIQQRAVFPSSPAATSSPRPNPARGTPPRSHSPSARSSAPVTSLSTRCRH
ncbi:eukaryotic initiation factor 4A-III homolog A [Brachypodium distachyon]|uniref:DEAD-box RNA helicase Q domain-containing protein n=1 Tax=Brachypodium distachyon TaxID=15368 RepID=I1HTD3_BRADI|nr:eukaryotic initiation factor 4A-III homolog A [Brachypodium distachyon]KQK10567.1 hypothetical protein BRADI_2g54910v3 [Brachypodium distachyon]|eukprot:XP_003564607.1 eukaryotic initiation factor 4A-III homolog A [Brachypodium distachyon]